MEETYSKLQVELIKTPDGDMESLGSIPSDAFTRKYLKDYLPERPIFVSNIHLWSFERISGEIRTPGSYPKYLSEFGYLSIGSSLSADFLCVRGSSGEVFWAASSRFLDGCDELIIKEDGEEICEAPSEAGFEKVLIYIGQFSESFLLPVLKGNYASLFDLLRKA